jgi:hypothetical protein
MLKSRLHGWMRPEANECTFSSSDKQSENSDYLIRDRQP